MRGSAPFRPPPLLRMVGCRVSSAHSTCASGVPRSCPEEKTGPFPADGLIPLLKPLYDYSWAVGLVAGFVMFVVLSRPAPRREPAGQLAPATSG